MKVYDRLMMELSNQSYLTQEQFEQLLYEQGLNPEEEYDKATMQRELLLTEIEVLETVANDIDTMTTISTEFANIGQAYEFIEARIQQIKDKVASIPDEEEDYNVFSLMYTRGGTRTMGGYITGISKNTIDKLD